MHAMTIIINLGTTKPLIACDHIYGISLFHKTKIKVPVVDKLRIYSYVC